MKKIFFFTILAQLISWSSASSQSSSKVDVEFQTFCMVDSQSNGVQIQFNRRVSMINPAQYSDHKGDMTGSYTVLGTAIPCKDVFGEKECWLKTDSTQYQQKIISITSGDSYQEYWLVELQWIETKSVSGYAASTSPLYNAPQIVPLAYPYGNTQDEADRFTKDIRLWLDCKGYCYIDDPIGGVSEGTAATPTGENTPYTTLRGLRLALSTAGGIQWYGAVYSRNHLDRGSYDYFRAGTTTTFNWICDMPFEVVRKETNGAIIYGINRKGEIKWPPFTGLTAKVDCGFTNARFNSCDRPSGPDECFVAQLDTQQCNYYCYIPTAEIINQVYVNGANIIPSGYRSDGGGAFNRSAQALADTLNKYIIYKNKYGKVDIANIQSTTYGWRITVKWTELSFDSIKTQSGGTYYFKRTGCLGQKYYTVSRNELGGILSCTDEQGDRRYLPGGAIKIPCGNLGDYSDCLNQNRSGDEFITNTTKIYNLTGYHAWSMVVLSGTATYTGYDASGSSSSATLSAGYSEDRRAETKCKYLSGKIQLVIPSGSTTKISYIW
ncbi:MAG: hypothetical protein K1X68_01430 [Saprospiraceae bacterium]|nr:hypothetical protein [Saprospiraceae bacterium]HMX89159.1 hypothetical protein [Saprospiraceae bacterium]HMZ40780.1 hypothetical protein [Saprospiraceae bacterium]HNA65623.1 hypothetical protein [Saprospiraceae bacterium]HNB61508.1 hypothetical protein [Saprospiraceae bacterium]